MNNLDLLRTACKLFGLYFFVLAAISMRDAIYYLVAVGSGSLSYDEDYLIMLVPFYLMVFDITAGLVLIFKANWITEKLQVANSGELNFQLRKTTLIEIVLIAISMLTLLSAIPEILHKLVSFMYFNDYEKSERHLFWSDGNTSLMFYSIFKLVAGLFLLLNARNFARRLKRIGDREDERVGV